MGEADCLLNSDSINGAINFFGDSKINRKNIPSSPELATCHRTSARRQALWDLIWARPMWTSAARESDRHRPFWSMRPVSQRGRSGFVHFEKSQTSEITRTPFTSPWNCYLAPCSNQDQMFEVEVCSISTVGIAKSFHDSEFQSELYLKRKKNKVAEDIGLRVCRCTDIGKQTTCLQLTEWAWNLVDHRASHAPMNLLRTRVWTWANRS